MKIVRSLIAALILGAIALIPHGAEAKYIPNDSQQCVDILAVFARGSSSNNEGLFTGEPFGIDFREKEHEAGRFFQQVEVDLKRDYPHIDYKAISIHDISNKYNVRGYPASGIFSFPTVNNAINAEVSWWPWGDYQDSVRDGREEVAGYLKDEIQRCPNQQIILGGYSQGAQVAGESVFDLSSVERQNIGALTLFGDPKFVGGDYNPLKFWEKPASYPWKRGTASAKERGMADARVPYVPTDMEKKTLSWCFEDDFVCSGYSGLRSLSKDDAGAGHKRYADFGISQAADEAIQLLAPKLYAVEKSKGGVDVSKGTAQPVPAQPTSKPIDFMFMINTSYNTDDVINELRFDTATVLNPLNNFFTNVNYAVGDFNENEDYFNYIPRVNIRQNLQAYNPSDPSPRLINTMYRQLAWGGLSGGGADVPDPHILAIEQAAVKGTWRDGAVKNLVIITDRPAKESFTYDLCAKNLKTNLDEAAPVVCSQNQTTQTFAVSAYPEVCKQIRQVLTDTNCDVAPSDPYYQKKITRTIQDAITVARTKGIAVSVVLPHAAKFAPGSTATATEKQLQNLATATGGLYLKYDVFNRASYSDMMWQILNRQPKTLRLAAYSLDQLSQDWATVSFVPSQKIIAKVGVPVTLDASQSNQTYSAYKWDFDNNGTWDETTTSPNTEHVFTATTDQLISVAGFTGDVLQASLTLPLSVTAYEGVYDDPISRPTLPSNITAMRKLDGSVQINWDATSGEEVLFVGDSTGIPIISSPVSLGTITILDGTGLSNALQLWIVGNSTSSARTTVDVTQEPPLVVVVPESTIVQALDTVAVQPRTINNPPKTTFTPQVAGISTTKQSNNKIPQQLRTTLLALIKKIQNIYLQILSIRSIAPLIYLTKLIFQTTGASR